MNVHYLLEARNRDLSCEDFTRGAIHLCDGNFHFLEVSEDRVVELCAVAVEAPHLSKEKTCAKGEETGAELFAEASLVRRGQGKIQQRQRDAMVQKLYTDANKLLVMACARSPS